MIKLDAGNVLLKPAQRRQLMSLLRRSVRLGRQLGNFVLTITMRRAGRLYELRADVHDAAGRFSCRSRQNGWRDAVRELSRALTLGVHNQCLARSRMG
jgi:hypothetical protein